MGVYFQEAIRNTISPRCRAADFRRGPAFLAHSFSVLETLCRKSLSRPLWAFESVTTRLGYALIASMLSTALTGFMLALSQPATVDGPMVHQVKQFLGLEEIPDSMIHEILEIQIEFKDGQLSRLTTLGHWVVSLINQFEYAEGLKSGRYRAQREEYFRRLLDRKLDPVQFAGSQTAWGAAETFAYVGDRLGGGQSFQLLKFATDLFLKSVTVLEIHRLVRTLRDQKIDEWLYHYLDSRNSGTSEENAWREIEPAITLNLNKEHLREHFENAHEICALLDKLPEIKASLGAAIRALIPESPTARRLVDSGWQGWWEFESTCSRVPPSPEQITIDLSSGPGYVSGQLFVERVGPADLRGPDNETNDLRLILRGGPERVGMATLNMKGAEMTGSIREENVSKQCVTEGPLRARLSKMKILSP